MDNLTCFRKCLSPSSSTKLSGLSTTSACALPGGLANRGRGIGSVGQRVYVFQDKREEFFFVYILARGLLEKGVLSNEKYVQLCLRRRNWKEGSKS